MREIRFRGKRLSDGKWVYGSYQADVLCLGKHTIIYGDLEGFYCEDEVDPKTVGQYTGLKDKNGKELYEGDIVRFTHVLHKKKAIEAKVVFHPVILAFVFMMENDLGYFTNNAEVRNLEIIGNVFDHPHLLKGDENA